MTKNLLSEIFNKFFSKPFRLVLASGIFLAISLLFALYLRYQISDYQYKEQQIKRAYKLWEQRGPVEEIAPQVFTHIDLWNKNLSERFTGRLLQDMTRKHPLFSETLYKLSQTVSVNSTELAQWLNIVSLSQNDRLNGAVLLTNFELSKQSREYQIKYELLIREKK